MPDITVLMPYYNTEEHPRHQWVKDATASILDQMGVGLRLIIVDNGSTSHNTASDMGVIACSNVSIIRNEVNDPGWMIRVIDRVDTPYCCIMCDDDELTEGALCRGQDALEQNPECGLAYGTHDTNTRPSFASLFVGDFIPWPGTLFQSEYLPLWKSRYVQEATLCADWSLWLEIASRSGIIAVPGGSFINQRIHEYSDTHQNGFGKCQFVPAHLIIWKGWIERGYRPTRAQWDMMYGNILSYLCKSHISFKDGMEYCKTFNSMRSAYEI